MSDTMRASRLLAVWMSIAVLGACATPPAPIEEAEPVAAVAPIALPPNGSHPIMFQSVLYRIPTGKAIGESWAGRRMIRELRWSGGPSESHEFNVAASDELTEYGYDVRDSVDAMFTPDSAIKARFQVAAIVHDIDVEYQFPNYGSRAQEGYGDATVDLEIHVFDSVEKQTVYERRLEAEGHDEGRRPNPVAAALLEGLRVAMSDPDFVAPLRLDSDADVAATPDEVEILLRERCDAIDLRLPDDIDTVLNASVTVLAGNASGAGVVVAEDGTVLTAAHVVADHDFPRVRFRSGLVLDAKVLRIDRRRDVAVLDVPGRSHACARTQSSPGAVVGMDVFVVGTPVRSELALSVSRGVVSGLPVLDGLAYIQTDASVSPGSSGGPMFDSAGRVVGVVSAKMYGPGVEGVAFGIPADAAAAALQIEWTERGR